MGNTYSASNLATVDRDRLRLLIGDTNTTAGKFIFDDLEVDEFLRQQSDLYSAAALACRSIVANQAKFAIAVTLLGGGYQVDRTAISKRFLELAEKFEQRAEAEPFSARTQWEDGDATYIDSLSGRTRYDFEDASS